MSGNSSTSSASKASHKEYIVRVPKLSRKRYHMMRFNADLGTDFFKSWSQCKMERENNMREYRAGEEMPKFGAGSEFGREQREEARRKRFGINVKQYKSESQPWMLNVGGKTGKKFKGIREGGVSDNVSWYVFMQGKDGAFEAYPVDEWYNFQPVQRYKALSAEEAEEEFLRRDKIMNYFQVMYEKKFRKDGKPIDDEEEGKKKGSKKSLLLSEMDDWMSDDEDEGEDDENNEGDSDDAGKKKKKKKKHLIKGKKNQGGKKKQEEAESDDSCEEESDEYNEGAEHDYISGDSSDSDQENEEVANKELAGVEEGDALRKLLESDEDEDENAEKDKDGEEKKKEEESDDVEKKKKKKKKDKKSDKDSDGSSDSSSEDGKKKKEGPESSSKQKKTVNKLKRKLKENLHEMNPQSKKAKLENFGSANSNTAIPPGSESMEEAIKRYLMRKPMTTTELLKNFKKKTELNSEQLVTSIAQILKRINPSKLMINKKMYLTLKT